jgi:transposase
VRQERAALGLCADERPCAAHAPPGVAYVYAPDCKHARPAEHLAGFSGILQVDGYGTYAQLAQHGDVALAFCWSHVRRQFYEIQVKTPAPIAMQAVVRIAALYAIEADIRGLSADELRQARQRRAKPLIDDLLRLWLEAQLAARSGKATVAGAIRYTLSRWDGLTRFLDDGRIEIDSSSAQSDRSRSGAKIISSPAPTAAASIGRMRPDNTAYHLGRVGGPKSG